MIIKLTSKWITLTIFTATRFVLLTNRQTSVSYSIDDLIAVHEELEFSLLVLYVFPSAVFQLLYIPGVLQHSMRELSESLSAAG